ncbi:hypothetical protein ACSSS7_003292 [Eimeria intestinalis]
MQSTEGTLAEAPEASERGRTARTHVIVRSGKVASLGKVPADRKRGHNKEGREGLQDAQAYLKGDTVEDAWVLVVDAKDRTIFRRSRQVCAPGADEVSRSKRQVGARVYDDYTLDALDPRSGVCRRVAHAQERPGACVVAGGGACCGQSRTAVPVGQGCCRRRLQRLVGAERDAERACGGGARDRHERNRGPRVVLGLVKQGESERPRGALRPRLRLLLLYADDGSGPSGVRRGLEDLAGILRTPLALLLLLPDKAAVDCSSSTKKAVTT